MPEIDQKRIALILDYWYDEGLRDGSGGNSKNYHQLLEQIRFHHETPPKNEIRRDAIIPELEGPVSEPEEHQTIESSKSGQD